MKEIGKLVSEIPDKAMEVLDKYFSEIKGKKFNLSGVEHSFVDGNGMRFPLDSEFYILDRETIILINSPSESELFK